MCPRVAIPTQALALLAVAASSLGSLGARFRRHPDCATVALLGDEAGWQPERWHSSTDAIRGGVSTAHLEEEADVDQGTVATFRGVLDPSILGAAFAGMVLPVEALPRALAGLKALAIEVLEGDEKEYAISLRLRGADSAFSYKSKFRAEVASRVVMPFADFEAEFRGRPAPEAPPLDPEEIESISIQTASGFGAQQGPFVLTLRRMAGELCGATHAGGLGVPLPEEVVSLLGDQASWMSDRWFNSTDAVRGGVSTAFLDQVEGQGAEFHGTLDPSILGAAFAGMVLPVEDLPRALAGLSGLSTEVLKGDGRKYSISLKMRGAARGVNHKFYFSAAEATTLEMPFDEFRAFKRGRPVEESEPPLELERVESITIQISSGFGEQQGPFSLTLRSVNGVVGSP